MSVTTRNPLRMVGAQINSGGVNTGEFSQVRGGSIAATIWSGAFLPTLTAAPGSIASGGEILFFSGAGRLNSYFTHVQMVSGVQGIFYDAGIISLSGVALSASGAKYLGQIPTSFAGAVVSGQAPILWDGRPVNLDVPFQSGLCCRAYSGCPGFTVTYTPETAPVIG